MAGSEGLVFEGVTEAEFARLKQKARANGIVLEGEGGRAAQMGVEVEWSYSAASGQLRLRCVSAPFFLSVADVEARLSKMVVESRG